MYCDSCQKQLSCQEDPRSQKRDLRHPQCVAVELAIVLGSFEGKACCLHGEAFDNLSAAVPMHEHLI